MAHLHHYPFQTYNIQLQQYHHQPHPTMNNEWQPPALNAGPPLQVQYKREPSSASCEIPINESELRAKSRNDLRILCSQYGENQKGTKEELIKRL